MNSILKGAGSKENKWYIPYDSINIKLLKGVNALQVTGSTSGVGGGWVQEQGSQKNRRKLLGVIATYTILTEVMLSWLSKPTRLPDYTL